ncbi:hypothetical protein CLOSCI_03806 [[Clostridium] scindens ATCC 35704]|nr:hypothetical protein CLOSCI_03806 [[Clostridium] scindens ATCC 35704]
MKMQFLIFLSKLLPKNFYIRQYQLGMIKPKLKQIQRIANLRSEALLMILLR